MPSSSPSCSSSSVPVTPTRRYSNPTHAALEAALAELEGAEAGLVTASGMAAIHGVVLSLLRSGDELIVPRAVYGGMVGLIGAILDRSGIGHATVDTTDPAQVEAAITDRTRLLWLETISNPTTAVADIATLAELAHARDVLLAVDNTFASPALANPLALGADVVVHSTTKYIGGHSDLMGGALVGTAERVAGGPPGRDQRRRQRGSARGIPGAARPEDPRPAHGAPLVQRAGGGDRARGRARRRPRPVSRIGLASPARPRDAHPPRRDGRRDARHRARGRPKRTASASWAGSASPSTPPASAASRRSSAIRPARRTASSTMRSSPPPACRPARCASRSGSRTPMT